MASSPGEVKPSGSGTRCGGLDLITDRVESQNDEPARSDARHERANQTVGAQLDPLTAIGPGEQPSKKGKQAEDDDTVRNPMIAGESLHPGLNGGNLFFRDHQQAIGDAGNGQGEP